MHLRKIGKCILGNSTREAHLQSLSLKFLASTFRMEMSVLSECQQEPPEAIGRVVVAPRLKLRGASSGFSVEGIAEVHRRLE